MKITDLAIQKIKDSKQFLVVLVEVGGCKGFVYDMFYSSQKANYINLNHCVLTNAYSAPFLMDCVLDFVEEIGYEDFIIVNSLVDYCNCGKSFI